MVQTMKRILKNSPDPYKAVLSYRATPLPWCKRSPAELLMGLCIRTSIPQTDQQLVPAWDYLSEFSSLDKKFKDKQKRDYNKRHRAQSLPEIPVDTDVWITTGEEPVPARVTASAHTPRSYIVNTQSGSVRRNRRDLNIAPDHSTEPEQQETVEPDRRIMTRSQTGTERL